VSRLLAREPHAVVVSARTGAGIDELLAAIEVDLPRPSVEIDALVPYARGDLVSKMHANGEVLSLEHTAEGSRIRALVGPMLAGELAEYAVAPAHA
jgi:GTP-binding protein HflX